MDLVDRFCAEHFPYDVQQIEKELAEGFANDKYLLQVLSDLARKLHSQLLEDVQVTASKHFLDVLKLILSVKDRMDKKPEDTEFVVSFLDPDPPEQQTEVVN